MPHTFAIGIYRQKEYDAAGMKILPLRRKSASTSAHLGVDSRTHQRQPLGGLSRSGSTTDLGGCGWAWGGFLWKAWTGLKTSGGGAWARDLFLLFGLSDRFIRGDGFRSGAVTTLQIHWLRDT